MRCGPHMHSRLKILTWLLLLLLVSTLFYPTFFYFSTYHRNHNYSNLPVRQARIHFDKTIFLRDPNLPSFQFRHGAHYNVRYARHTF